MLIFKTHWIKTGIGKNDRSIWLSWVYGNVFLFVRISLWSDQAWEAGMEMELVDYVDKDKSDGSSNLKEKIRTEFEIAGQSEGKKGRSPLL